MKNAKLCIIALTLAIISCFSQSIHSQVVDFTYPDPDSKYHKSSTAIVLKKKSGFKSSEIESIRNTSILGKESGLHLFITRIVDENRTILLCPVEEFRFGETVRIDFEEGIQSDFDFQIEMRDLSDKIDELGLYADLFFSNYRMPLFPEASVEINGDVGDGFIYGTKATGDENLFILDNEGEVVESQNMNGITAQNFRYVNDSMCVYATLIDQAYFVLDTSFQIIDTIQCQNGYATDFHDIQFTEDGHVILLGFDPQIIDMSQIVEGGDPQAYVTGLVIQKLDAEGNLIFQWRSWDHFEITDALYQGTEPMDFTSGNIDYVHANSIEVAPDGHLILCSRHMSEVTKIDGITGDIIWRLGGLNNEFTFIDDPLNGFNIQHDARITENNNLMIFDNGYYHDPQQTRIIEYLLDEEDMTATLDWEFLNPYGDITIISGNAQRLENGNTFINWGRRLTQPPPQDYFLEIDSLENHVFELSFTNPGEMGWIYRAYRLPYKNDTIQTVGFNDPLEIERIRIFPNPANDGVYIDIPEQAKGSLSLTLFDIEGRMISKWENIKRDDSGERVRIELMGFTSGLYFLQFSESGKSYPAEKLMIRE